MRNEAIQYLNLSDYDTKAVRQKVTVQKGYSVEVLEKKLYPVKAVGVPEAPSELYFEEDHSERYQKIYLCKVLDGFCYRLLQIGEWFPVNTVDDLVLMTQMHIQTGYHGYNGENLVRKVETCRVRTDIDPIAVAYCKHIGKDSVVQEMLWRIRLIEAMHVILYPFIVVREVVRFNLWKLKRKLNMQ